MTNLAPNSDSVSIAFDMILEELQSVVSDVNLEGAAYLRNNDYDKAKASINIGEKLAIFKGKLESLKNEWLQGLDEPSRQHVRVEPKEVARAIASSTRAPRTVLVVKFEDGTVIFESKAAETMAKTIKKMGVQRVESLGRRVNNYPLVSKSRVDGYTQTQVDSYWVMTHCNTEAKRDLLLSIAKALNEKISVDIVPA